jgi:hypothetical protein
MPEPASTANDSVVPSSTVGWTAKDAEAKASEMVVIPATATAAKVRFLIGARAMISP